MGELLWTICSYIADSHQSNALAGGNEIDGDPTGSHIHFGYPFLYSSYILFAGYGFLPAHFLVVSSVQTAVGVEAACTVLAMAGLMSPAGRK